jgi:hypothetical protein
MQLNAGHCGRRFENGFCFALRAVLPALMLTLIPAPSAEDSPPSESKPLVGPPGQWVAPVLFTRLDESAKITPGEDQRWLLIERQFNAGENDAFCHVARQILPLSTRTKDTIEYRWDFKKVAAVKIEDSLPTWYDPALWIQLSEFDTWAGVNQWALNLFRTDSPLSRGNVPDRWCCRRAAAETAALPGCGFAALRRPRRVSGPIGQQQRTHRHHVLAQRRKQHPRTGRKGFHDKRTQPVLHRRPQRLANTRQASPEHDDLRMKQLHGV